MHVLKTHILFRASFGNIHPIHRYVSYFLIRASRLWGSRPGSSKTKYVRRRTSNICDIHIKRNNPPKQCHEGGVFRRVVVQLLLLQFLDIRFAFLQTRECGLVCVRHDKKEFFVIKPHHGKCTVHQFVLRRFGRLRAPPHFVAPHFLHRHDAWCALVRAVATSSFGGAKKEIVQIGPLRGTAGRDARTGLRRVGEPVREEGGDEGENGDEMRHSVLLLSFSIETTSRIPYIL